MYFITNDLILIGSKCYISGMIPISTEVTLPFHHRNDLFRNAVDRPLVQIMQEWNGEHIKNMECTYFPNTVFTNLHLTVVLMFIYYIFELMYSFLLSDVPCAELL
jgi:hypothetical protein